MSDADKMFRWLTQAELDATIERERMAAAESVRRSLRELAWEHTRNEVLDIAISAFPLSLSWEKRK